MSMLVNFLKRTIFSRAGSILLGLCAFIALVWFAGPYLGIREIQPRLIIIAAVLVLVLLYYVISWIITRRRAARFNQELAAQGVDEGHRADVEALRQKMQDAIAALKSSELGIKHRGKAALYALPWYMIIGPSAAGKSTLLRNSGLHFPYSHADDIDIKGVGGTRNCDWWFSDQAVILDTAGRYTTQENDKKEWLEFLALLKKHRRKMPINGIIVAISLSELLTADDAGLDWHVKVVRDRINELTTQLGFVFPLYIVFTKCDLLNGFESFFGDLNENVRSQVWGSYLEITPGENPGDVVDRKLGELYVRLCEWRIRKIHMQRKLQLKTQIYDFPAQFQAAAMRLLEFINLLFKDNPYQETPNFKGIYFTSGTQEGLPLQRIVGNLRQAFGYVDSKESLPDKRASKSYFIRQLFKDVIFKSPIDVHMSRRKQIFNRWFKTAAIMCSFGIVGAVLAAYSTTFTNNSLLLNAGSGVIESLYSVQQNNRATTADEYLALSHVYEQYLHLKKLNDNRPWYFRLGIYHGETQVEPIEKILIKTLERDFLVPIARMLEARLDDFAKRWKTLKTEAELAKLHSDYYDALKMYLMLSSPKHLDSAEATPYLLTSWQSMITPPEQTPSKELKQALDSYSEALVRKYLEHMHLPASHTLAATHWRVDNRPVRVARAQLQTPPNAEVLYTQVVKKSESLLKPLTLRYALTSRGSSYLDNKQKLSGIYTRGGWEDFASREFKVAIHMASYGDWVLGNEQIPDAGDQAAVEANKETGSTINVTLAKELEQQIRQRYFADYVQAWYDFLGGIEVQRDRSVSDSANKLVLFASTDGPIAELFKLVDDNINLQEVSWRQDDTNPKLYQKIPIKGSKVKELERPFEDMRRFTTPAEKMPVSDLLNKYLIALTALQGEFEQLRNTSEQKREAELIAANVLSGKGNSTAVYQTWATTTGILNGSDPRNRQVIEPVFMAPIKDSWRMLLGGAVAEVQGKWASLVLADYEERIRGRFPFVENGPDAALEDVSEFFHPNDGVLWAFVRDHLGAYIYKHNGEWRERSWMGMSPGFNRSFISALNNSEHITNSLFKRGGTSPEMTFYLYPMPTPGISEITLETNGQMYRYRNEPQEWRKFEWPGPTDRTGASVVAISEKQNLRAEENQYGTWGIFHLLRKARVVKEQGTQYLSEWKMESYNGKPVTVSFRVKADRTENLLQPDLFTNFSIPRKIIGSGEANAAAVASRD